MRDQPSEVLTRAADLIRDTAAKAAAGPWVVVDDGWCIRSEPTDDRKTWQTVTADTPMPEARWIALLNPAVAEPLDEWLLAANAEYCSDAEHRQMRIHNSGGRQRQWEVSDAAAAALAFARHVLGLENTPEETP